MEENIRKDLTFATEYLLAHPSVKVVAAKDGVVLGTKDGDGIQPLLNLIQDLGPGLHGASVADRVIGEAAAILLIRADVKGVFGETLSLEAEARLTEAKITVAGRARVPCILRRDRTDRCPMEKQVHGVRDLEEATERLFKFLGLPWPAREFFGRSSLPHL